MVLLSMIFKTAQEVAKHLLHRIGLAKLFNVIENYGVVSNYNAAVSIKGRNS